MQYEFRKHNIVRTCTKKYSEHSLYKPSLKKDFNNRCAYCNLLDSLITTSFEVDHFIPKKAFKGKFDGFDTLYENLIYSCKKCNAAKSSKYQGNLVDKIVENLCFYNPVEIDMNQIFYRNEYGFIMSKDKKGKEMIIDLHLHHPIHALAWIVEKIRNLIKSISKKIENCIDEEKKKEYVIIKGMLNDYHSKLFAYFVANYNNKFLEISKLLDL